MKIDKGIPIPKKSKYGNTTKRATIHLMEVGDSVLFKDYRKAEIFRVNAVAALRGTKFNVMKRTVKGSYRIWKVKCT